MKPFVLALLLASASIASTAFADEVIVTHPVQASTAEAPAAPPLADPERAQRQANGDWARRVMAGAANAEDVRNTEDVRDEGPRGCQRNPDRSPHGEVWVGVGTGGYNSAGA